MSDTDLLDTFAAFMRAAQAGDLEAMRTLMSESFAGYITTADGGVRRVDRDGYIASIDTMDVRSANLRMEVPNAVVVEPGRVLAMIEIRAERGGRSLHNFTGQLARVEDGAITELWMVEALPAESDAFWATDS